MFFDWDHYIFNRVLVKMSDVSLDLTKDSRQTMQILDHNIKRSFLSITRQK